MAKETFENLDVYEDYIQARVKRWSAARKIVLTAAMAERWLPAYEKFSASEAWGDPAILRQSLDAVWGTLSGKLSSSAEWHRLADQVHQVTPHLDDFDANEALCACIIVQYAIQCCTDRENTTSSTMAVLSGLEAVRPDLLTSDPVPAHLWKQAAVHKEIDRQLRLIEQIEALTTLENAQQTLNPFLTSPEMLGEVRPKPKPKPAPGRSNQELFEQYGKIIASDIKSAARGLDPQKNPEFATILYLSTWMSRYSRRKQILSGEYGFLADQIAINLLQAKNRAKDMAETDLADWEPATRATIELCYQNTRNGFDASTPEGPHGYGPSLRRLWINAKRRGLSNQAAWEDIKAWAQRPPQTPAKADKKNVILLQALARPLSWSATDSVEVPWATDVDGIAWKVQLNDFPDEMMYSLVMDEKIVGNFHDWPKVWARE